jgi:hypothetical protein
METHATSRSRQPAAPRPGRSGPKDAAVKGAPVQVRRALEAEGPPDARQVLDLQRKAGNQAVARAVGRIAADPRHARRDVQRRDVQRRDVQHSVAKIRNCGVNVRNEIGASNQIGHAMDVWVEIDCGSHPVTPPGAPPNSVYGLEFEYWEYVNVPRDNDGTVGEKQWNDIHGLKPDAATFTKPAAGCDMTWAAAVASATAGTLTGRHRIGFQDIPGLWPKPNRTAERTLKFRIVFNDGTRHEIFATQLLRMSNGQMAYSAYMDNKGNHVEAHGFGPNYQGPSQTEKNLITAEPNRLAGTQLPTLPKMLLDIPGEATAALQAFVVDAVQGQGAPYVDMEMGEFVGKVDQAKQLGAGDDWTTLFAQSFRGDVTGGVAAGQFMIPQIAGAVPVQKKLPSGGLLVALVTGNNVRRVYYTDNSKTHISMNFIPQLQGKNWTIGLRSFAEFPTETIQDSLDVLRARNMAMKNMTLTGADTHLRAFTQSGRNFIVTVGTKVGNKIKDGATLSVFEPEQRDVTGEWVKAQYGGKTGFVRISKLAGAKTAADWTRAAAAAQRPPTGSAAVKTFLEDRFRTGGKGYRFYQQLETTHAGIKSEVAKSYKAVFSDADYYNMELDRETAQHTTELADLTNLAQMQDGNQAGLIRGVMRYVKGHPGEGDKLESVYNQHVATAGYDVPRTMGEIVHTYFVDTFKAQGGRHGLFDILTRNYPDFAYRLRPAYREVFGDDALQQMLQNKETAEKAADPATSRANQDDARDFLIHGPFSLTDYVPTAGAGSGKFDATYDPITDAFDITVKVTYEFIDSRDTPLSLASRPPSAASSGRTHGVSRKRPTGRWPTSRVPLRLSTTPPASSPAGGRAGRCSAPSPATTSSRSPSASTISSSGATKRCSGTTPTSQVRSRSSAATYRGWDRTREPT